MTVTLVKSYFTAGWSMPGCLPEAAPVLFTTLDAAREYLADELERSAAEWFMGELDAARVDYVDEASYLADFDRAHEDSASMEGSAGIVRNDPDGDIRATGAFCSSEPDGYAYWIEPFQP